MKRILGISVAVLVVAGIGIYAFREPLKSAAMDRVTSNMFVATDDDTYDPGVSVGQPLPAVRATYRDSEVTQLGQFAGANGMVVYVNRSVDW
jgi:hypothetical protein